MNKGNKRSFEAQRILKTNKSHTLKLQNDNEEFIQNEEEKVQAITRHYQTFFNSDKFNSITPWRTPPQPLDPPITQKDITHVTYNHLQNGRATGSDKTQGELYKYGSRMMHYHLAIILNTIFEKNEEVKNINELILIPINKPNKKGYSPQNTRPIQLVNMIRKILSSLILKEMQTFAENYVSITQSGYRANRSTCDIIWTYRWFMATTEKYKETFHMMGIDLSKAFDCIDRSILLNILEGEISDKAIRIIQYLISNTCMKCQVGKSISKSFQTNQGIPQGDALSPVLFIIYLEHIMRVFKAKHPTITEDQLITHYADDTDFWSFEKDANDKIEQLLPETMKDFNMKMNLSKTEKIVINKSTVRHIPNKKLGSIFSNSQDMHYKITKAAKAFHSMNKLWLDKARIGLKTKIRMYNACVKSILMENIAPLAVTYTELERISATHRRHLRFLANIFHPRHITNEHLYQITGTYDIRIDIINCRWKFFGHMLRSQDIPGKQVMEMYFTLKDCPKFKGKLRTSLPTLLHQELTNIGSSLLNINDLKAQEELALRIKKRKRTFEMENGIKFVYSEYYKSQGHSSKRRRTQQQLNSQQQQQSLKNEKEQDPRRMMHNSLLGEFAVTLNIDPQDFL
mmetsp:Transcript_13196/g.24331  ORF Transcript_13196/g.24331 Transcript_13196/m.24331 type:complete len:628 (+) Transcript_13196:361-2244(+)